MGTISEQALPPVLLPFLAEQIYFRAREALIPAKLNQAALINALDAHLRRTASTPLPSRLALYKTQGQSYSSELNLGKLISSIVIAKSPASLFFDDYDKELAKEGIALFYGCETPKPTALIRQYSHFLWHTPDLLVRTEAHHCLENAARHRQFEKQPSFLAQTLQGIASNGEFLKLTLAATSLADFSERCNKARKFLSAGLMDEAEETLYHKGWGLSGLRFAPESTKDTSPSLLHRRSFSLLPEELGSESLATLVAAICSWLNHECNNQLSELKELMLSAPTFALHCGLIGAFRDYSPTLEAKITAPDLLYGYSPLHSFLSLRAKPTADRLFVSAENFPTLWCAFLTNEGLPS